MTEKKELNYREIASSPAFQRLLKRKRLFIAPIAIFFFVYYFSLPVLTSYFTFLNQPAIGAITWAWLFAITQFIMTWVLCILYSKKAAQFDQDVNALKNEIGGTDA
ncbi:MULTISPECIES: DUF485 domain-containing protein [Bacillus]|uniref:DUF485 domain-containing protein n=2 Tax=Bacillus TaxID=1386 RepID=A0A0M4FVY1_9BACI|nr:MULTISPECIES: DUF485 domain-containing protein [Bacillus]ALC82818.1 hypothetical protein AM592_15405 [Bacillus gobiensis]MBP1081781.1 uncharacterized membrane protein (DUF485 family) [Bacillus capparidis]MED1096432.1 DUF485 domain-containing protein [Bacillus capparidis]